MADFGAMSAVVTVCEGSSKTQKLLTKFPGLATSGRHNSALITNRRKFTSKFQMVPLWNV